MGILASIFRLSRSRAFKPLLGALHKSHAVIEFDMSGRVLTANDNFLRIFGYELSEIAGQHHRIFVGSGEAATAGYAEFWRRLSRGEYQSAQFKRITKSGTDVWIQASYNPVLDRAGHPQKVVKIATEISAQKFQAIEFASQIKAINKSQCVIHFAPDGTVLSANRNFLDAFGYGLDEVVGQPHHMFVSAEEKNSAAYKEFWAALGRGEYQAAEYIRLGKGGKSVWIQATYNPIVDPVDGKVLKVVKFAMDVTDQVAERNRRTKIQQTIDADIGEITTALGHVAIQTTEAAASSTQTSDVVDAVATAAENMAKAIGDISISVGSAARMSEKAVGDSNGASSMVGLLTQAAGRIGEITKLIQRIAGQTNMLALNATIEAARAGQAGRGFSVVANEVKSLAAQTERATQDIADQIKGVQSASDGVASAIVVMAETIKSLNVISGSVSASVHAQSQVTHDISANMHSASANVGQISGRMSEIAAMTKIAEESLRKLKKASQDLVVDTRPMRRLSC